MLFSPSQAKRTSVPNCIIKLAAADIKNVLGSANTNVNDADLTRLIESLKGKDINKLIATGLAKVGSGSAPAPAAKGDSKPAAQEKKK